MKRDINESSWTEDDFANAIVGACDGSWTKLRNGLKGLSKQALKKLYKGCAGIDTDEIDTDDVKDGKDRAGSSPTGTEKKPDEKHEKPKHDKDDADDEEPDEKKEESIRASGVVRRIIG